MLPERTPSEHRAIVAKIMAKVPANDNTLFGRKPTIGATSKHAALSDELEGLRHWRAFRAADRGWLAPHAANDNGPETPCADATIVARPSADFLASAADGDEERDDKGRLIRRGRVLFSNGEQYEPAWRYDEYGRQVPYMARIPQGAVIGTLPAKWNPADPDSEHKWRTPSEKAELARGARAKKEDNERRNDHFRWYAGADKPGAAFFPMKPKNLWELFIGGQNRKRPRGHDHVDDEPHLLSERQRHVEMMMTPLEVEILDAALSARSFEQIGRLVGCTNAKSAERAGRPALIAAAKRFEEVRRTMP